MDTRKGAVLKLALLGALLLVALICGMIWGLQGFLLIIVFGGLFMTLAWIWIVPPFGFDDE